jgi:hypothetical protein
MHRKVFKIFGSGFLWLKDMRNYILTPKERKTLKTFIESGTQLNGYSVLILRLRRAQNTLKQDLALITEALKKAES